MNLMTRVNKRIEKYSPNRAKSVIRYILSFSSVNHEAVKDHSLRVSLLMEAVAETLGLDARACFLAGLLHDVGKLSEPFPLFNGHNISDEEFEQIKKHPKVGHNLLIDVDRFLAICVGLSHPNYGLTLRNLPTKWSRQKANRAVVKSMVLFVCDCTDSNAQRQTKARGIKGKKNDVKSIIYQRLEECPDKEKRLAILASVGLPLEKIIDVTLREYKKLNFPKTSQH